MNRSQAAMLGEMGIAPLWRLRESPEAEAEQSTPPLARQAITPVSSERVVAPIMPAAQASASAPITDFQMVRQPPMGWDALSDAVRSCQTCELCQRRKQAVLGVGDTQANWMIIGEGPGAEEDEQGEPFVGQAGKLLDAMLQSIGLNRHENVYITDAVKCRPPGSRTPESSELDACRPYLEAQIALIKPKLIIAMGRPAAQTLLGAEIKIGAARGQVFAYQGIPVIVSYHPSYLLRNQSDKAGAWEDLCFARAQADKWV